MKVIEPSLRIVGKAAWAQDRCGQTFSSNPRRTSIEVERRERPKAAAAAERKHEMIEGAERREERANFARLGGVERPGVDCRRCWRPRRKPLLVAAGDRDLHSRAGESPRSRQADARSSADDDSMFWKIFVMSVDAS